VQRSNHGMVATLVLPDSRLSGYNEKLWELRETPRLSEEHAIIERVRTAVKQRRIPLQAFFEAYDLHNSKKISKRQFLRALDNSGLGVTTAEADTLCSVYKSVDPGCHGLVRYLDFCDCVNRVFTVKELEKFPSQALQYALGSVPAPHLGLDHPELNAAERLHLIEAIDEMRRTVSERGVVVESLFRDFDHTHSGNVTGEQLLRIISAHQLLDGKKVTYTYIHFMSIVCGIVHIELTCACISAVCRTIGPQARAVWHCLSEGVQHQ
jgi:Ca2+-binding EF-hand superfamily protein